MLFGLINALVIFQQRIYNILCRFLDITCIYYLDNILIYSKNKEDYKKHIQQISIALREADITAKLSKYRFGITEVIFLGFIINIKGIRIDLAKI
jgi:hypothetical protein